MEKNDVISVEKNSFLNQSEWLILEIIGKLGIVSTLHIATALSKHYEPISKGSMAYIRKKLRIIENKGYIKHTPINTGSLRYNYFGLTKLGKDILCDHIHQSKDMAYSCKLYIDDHQDYLADIGSRILRIINNSQKVQNGGIIDCFNDSSLYYRDLMNLFRETVFGSAKKGLKPDLTYINEYKKQWSFFEIDTGTEQQRILMDKITKYQDILLLNQALTNQYVHIAEISLNFILCSPDPYKKREYHLQQALKDCSFKSSVINYRHTLQNGSLDQHLFKGLLL